MKDTKCLGGVLERHKRIAIAGGPLTGKTSLAAEVTDRPVFHTDEYMDLPWSDQPLKWLDRLRDLPSFVLEGVQVPRTLRKGLVVDAVIWLDTPKEILTPGQARMAKAVATVYREWKATHSEVPEYTGLER